MSLPAENVSGFDTWGRRRTCIVCGDPIRHPRIGRPRVLCRKKECLVTRHRLGQRRKPRREWTQEDRMEALRLWQDRCGVCLRLLVHVSFSSDRDPLPVCDGCRTAPLTIRALRWLDRCVPGAPLPNPWKGVWVGGEEPKT